MALSLFTFEHNNSPLKTVSGTVKILFFIPAIILLFYLELKAIIVLFFLSLIVSCILGFSLLNQLKDFLPLLPYLIIYYITAVITNFTQSQKLAISLFLPSAQIILAMFRFLVTVELANLFYKTTTTSQIKNSLEQIEMYIRNCLTHFPLIGKRIQLKTNISFLFTLMLIFIPHLINLWNQLELAWRARGGKTGMLMFKKLFPKLLFLAFIHAENTWLTIKNRLN